MMTFLLPLILLISSPLIPQLAAIFSGEMIDWNRHGFLAKILARDQPEEVKSCTGTVISASLVLTSGQCVVDGATKQKLREFVVFLAKPGKSEYYRSTAKLLELKEDGSWALLRIPPQNITELCPENPAPKWVSRLNFRPSLTADPRLTVTPMEMGDQGCNLIGFSTTEMPEDFLAESGVRRLFIDRLEPPATDDEFHHWHSKVYENFTACFDDGGAPVMCSLKSFQEPFIQVGLFQSLTVPGGGNANAGSEEEPLEKCLRATEMRFSLFHDDPELARAIERHALAEFVTVYEQCGFAEMRMGGGS